MLLLVLLLLLWCWFSIVVLHWIDDFLSSEIERMTRVLIYMSFALAHSGQMMSASSVIKPRPTSDVLQLAQMKQSLCQCRSSNEIKRVPPIPWIIRKRIIHWFIIIINHFFCFWFGFHKKALWQLYQIWKIIFVILHLIHDIYHNTWLKCAYQLLVLCMTCIVLRRAPRNNRHSMVYHPD